LTGSIMRSVETEEQEQVETSTVQRQSEPGRAAVAATAPPIVSIPVVQPNSVGIQAKLTVGAIGDVYEQEADRVAAQVMSMPVAAAAPPQVQRFGEEHNPIGMYSSLARSITPVVHRQVDQQVQMQSMVQRAFKAGGNEASGDLESRLNASSGGGSALAPEVRAFMEPRFGADFSGVRVHTGNEAVQMNRELGAQAFAHGSDVYFGAGKSPGNNELTAHELTHVVQQTGGAVQREMPKVEKDDKEKTLQTQIIPGQLIIQRVVALSAKDYEALAEQIHEAIAGLGTDEEAIYVTLQKLEKDATAIGELKKVYQTKYKADLEAEIRSEMSGEELRLALDLIGIKDDPKQGGMVGAAPSTDDEYKAVAKTLYNAMNGAGTDEEAIYSALIPFNRDATKLQKLKDTYQNEFSGGLTGKGLEEDIKDEMSSDELAYALYLLNAPPPKQPHPDEVTVNNAGTEAHTSQVPGGNVSVHTGTEMQVGSNNYTEAFSMGYQGGLAAETRWLQFIWREIVVTHPTKGTYRVNRAITTTGGTYNLTTDPTSPNYNTDSADSNSPFYEAAFVDNRTADATTIFDLPSSMNNIVQSEFAAGATQVVSRAHFNTYLIRDYKTLHHVYLQVEWNYTSPTVPPRTQTVQSASAVDSLPADMKARLVQQYPSFAYIQ